MPTRLPVHPLYRFPLDPPQLFARAVWYCEPVAGGVRGRVRPVVPPVYVLLLRVVADAVQTAPLQYLERA